MSDVRSNQIAQWKLQAVENMASAFEWGAVGEIVESERKTVIEHSGKLSVTR